MVIRDFHNLLQIANTAPHHGAAGLGSGFDGRRQVSAHVGTVDNFIAHIHNQHIAFHQGFNNPLVEKAMTTFHISAVIEHGHMHIRTGRNHNGGYRTANQLVAGMGGSKIAFELMVVFLIKQWEPGFLQLYLPNPFQRAVGHLGTAVRKTLALPKGG